MDTRPHLDNKYINIYIIILIYDKHIINVIIH